MHNFHSMIDEIIQTNENVVLATVIKVEGSAYRKAGATMLFQGEKQIGTISAGCLEADVAIRVKKMLASNVRSEVIIYDMKSEDDLGWGRGAGCNGKIHLLLEVIDENLRKIYAEVKENLNQGLETNIVKVLHKDRQVVHTFLLTLNQTHYYDGVKIKPCRQSRSYPLQSPKIEVFLHYVQPKERLIIFGAGPDVPPLVQMATQIGLSVYIWDWRQPYLKDDLFAEASLIGGVSIEDFLQEISFTKNDSVIVMTHDFMMDKKILQVLLTYDNMHYLGILGPKKRTKRLVQNAPLPSYVHSPVGLSIGAEGPEEIAISILAEVIKQNRMVNGDQKERFFDRKKDYRGISRSG